MEAAPGSPVKASMPKAEKVDPELVSIVDAIDQVESLPYRCRTMLVSSLPLCFGAAAHDRHEIQTSIIDMVKLAFSEKKASMLTAIAAEEEKLASLQASTCDIAKGVEAAETALTAQTEAVESATSLFVDATAAANACTNALAERRAEQQASGSKLAGLESEKAGLEGAMEAHFVPMKEGVAGEHLESLQPHLKNLNVEASLLIALPTTCTKSLEERGSFDQLIMDELAKALSTKIASLGGAVAAEQRLSQEHDASVLAAQEEHSAKHDTLKQSAAELEAAKEKQRALEVARNDAKRRADELQPEIDAQVALVEKSNADVAAFESGPMASLQSKSLGETEVVEAAQLGA
jgi:hypothetical protein